MVGFTNSFRDVTFADDSTGHMHAVSSRWLNQGFYIPTTQKEAAVGLYKSVRGSANLQRNSRTKRVRSFCLGNCVEGRAR